MGPSLRESRRHSPAKTGVWLDVGPLIGAVGSAADDAEARSVAERRRGVAEELALVGMIVNGVDGRRWNLVVLVGAEIAADDEVLCFGLMPRHAR